MWPDTGPEPHQGVTRVTVNLVKVFGCVFESQMDRTTAVIIITVSAILMLTVHVDAVSKPCFCMCISVSEHVSKISFFRKYGNVPYSSEKNEINPLGILLLMYADDIVIVADSPFDHQRKMSLETF